MTRWIFSAAAFLAAGAFLAACAAPAAAQFKEGETGGAKLGAAQAHKLQVGVKVTAVGGPCRGIVGYVPVPVEWPEQTVKVAAQDISPGVKVSYQTLDEGVRIMVVHIPLIQANEELKALVTFEVTRSMQLPPPDPAAFVLPAGKQLGADLRRYLARAPRSRSATRRSAGRPRRWGPIRSRPGSGCKPSTIGSAGR